MNDITIARKLARYAIGLSFNNLPAEVVRKTKRCILDSIGCILGGFKTKIGDITADMAKYLEGKPQSTLLGGGYKTSAPYAALFNAMLANILDYDDTANGHPGATIIPSALAVSEAVETSGKDLLTAVVLGYEISLRIGEALKPSFKQQWKIWGFGSYQVFGAVSAAGKLLELNEDEFVNALGVAGCNAPVSSLMRSIHGISGVTMVKNNFGKSAETGVIAALLAKRGFTGPEDILDGDEGFWRMYGSDQCDFDLMTSGLNNEYKIVNVEFKPYPCCRFLHSAIDGVLNIVRKHQITPKQIEEITINATKWVTKPPFNVRRPKSMLEAQFSPVYCMGVALSGIKPGPDWFKKSTLNNPEVLNIAKKVKIVPHEEEYTLLTRADVELKANGKKYTSSVEYPKGAPQNDMTDDELDDKFKSLAVDSIKPRSIELAINTIRNLESVMNVKEFMDLFSL
ncbi:MAG: MmgE/PrpD family protein [Candidatus Hodarchaeota archaeon]